MISGVADTRTACSAPLKSTAGSPATSATVTFAIAPQVKNSMKSTATQFRIATSD